MAHSGESRGGRSAPSAVFAVSVASRGLRVNCREDQSLLAAMIANSVKAVPIGCRSGGCGVCRVQVLSGEYRTGFMNRSIVSAAEESEGILLACRTYPTSDIGIEPLPLQPSCEDAPLDRAA